MNLRSLLNLLLILGLVTLARADEAAPPAAAGFAPHLESLASYVGTTWRGEFADSTPDKPKVDVQSWERILNGQAIRVRHSINDGEYGGETIIVWDEAKQSLVYWYFTTAGFQTQGTMIAGETQYSSHEFVTGAAEGITEVEGLCIRARNGERVSRTRYLQNGAWVEGHTITYKEDPTAVVRFR